MRDHELWTNDLPKASPSNTITSGIKVPAYEFWGDTNMQTIAYLTKRSEILGRLRPLGNLGTSREGFRRRQWHPTPVLLPGKSHGWGAWKAAVHGVARSRTQLSDFTFTFYFPALEKEMATHSSILAWEIPWTQETGSLPPIRSQKSRTRLSN